MFRRLFIAAFFVLSQSALTAELVLVRHGNSQHNQQNAYNSNPNHPHYKVSHLTPLGIKQVTSTAHTLLEKGLKDENVLAVFVSPLPRTQETAQILSKAGIFDPKKIRLEPRLIEVQAGDREGLSTDLFDGDHWERHDAHLYHGETNNEVRDRVIALYNDTLEEFRHQEGHVLYVTHGMATYELIDLLKEQRIRLGTAEAMLLPMKHPLSTLPSSPNIAEQV